jgi:hypothetical protein
MKSFSNRSLSRTNGFWCVLPVFLALLAAAADDEPPWRSKQIPEWSVEDANQVLFDSPWAKTFTPILTAPLDSGRKPGGIGRDLEGVGKDAVGLALPGIAARRAAGSASQGGESPAGQSTGSSSSELPKLTLRWESAMPVRTAELKVHDNNAPDVDESHYAIAVYGIPDRKIQGDLQKLGDQLRNEAFLKRDGKKDLKPSSVRVFDMAAGRVVLYSFPMSDEITRADHRVEFTARIGRLDLDQSFLVDNMVWQGKLEL